MASYPTLPQGSLNRAAVSVTFPNEDGYDIKPEHLGAEMVSISFTSPAAVQYPTATGLVTSLSVFQSVQVTIHLLRTQTLAAKFETRRQTNSAFDTMVVRGDATNMAPWTYQTMVLTNIDPMNLNGTEPGYVLQFTGKYLVNSDMFA